MKKQTGPALPALSPRAQQIFAPAMAAARPPAQVPPARPVMAAPQPPMPVQPMPPAVPQAQPVLPATAAPQANNAPPFAGPLGNQMSPLAAALLAAGR